MLDWLVWSTGGLYPPRGYKSGGGIERPLIKSKPNTGSEDPSCRILTGTHGRMNDVIKWPERDEVFQVLIRLPKLQVSYLSLIIVLENKNVFSLPLNTKHLVCVLIDSILHQYRFIDPQYTLRERNNFQPQRVF